MSSEPSPRATSALSSTFTWRERCRGRCVAQWQHLVAQWQGCQAQAAQWSQRLRSQCPPCVGIHCPGRKWKWGPLWPVWERVFLDGDSYCGACLPEALDRCFANCRPPDFAPQRSAHRIPLGLLLVSRGWLTEAQLRSGLARQQSNGGRLGESLRALGYVHEEEVTAGLAIQWACPMLLQRCQVPEKHLRRIPLRLQELHGMVPVHYSESAGVLVLAFADGIDYSVTHAVARMLDCRIEPCLAPETEIRRTLASLQELQPGIGPGSGQCLEQACEITFERVPDDREKSAVTGSYVQRWGARRVRVTACGGSVWARLERPGQTLDLIFEATASAVSAA